MPTASMQASGPRPAGHRLEALEHIPVVEVQRLGAAVHRQAQPLGHIVDGDDALGAEEEGAPDGHLPDLVHIPTPAIVSPR
jgi:hypothetical protein